jgi:hypothetical protein
MKTKTAYVASRTSKREEVKRIYSKLEKIGYSIPNDWTNHKDIKPYSENPKLAEAYSIEDIEGSRKSDLFIIIEDDAGTGIHSELGAAISNFIDFGKPLIYAIGKSFNGSIFYFHPSVKRRRTEDDVIKELKDL